MREGVGDDCRYLPHAHALCSPEPLLRLKAHALSTLVSFVPASVAVFHRLTPRGRAREAVGVQTARPDLSMPDVWRGYVESEQDSDPFVTSRAIQSNATVLTLADVCGECPGRDARYGRHLDRLRLGDRVTIYLRDAGTIIAVVALVRSADEPAFSKGEASALRRIQPLLEHAYACARSASATVHARDLVLDGGLTPREADVAGLVARGATNAEIARSLHVAEATVKTHLTHIFAKLGVRSRTQLALLLEHGRLQRSSDRAAAGG
jgi:DNA-binding CsgD family transcriptional regulator